MKKIVHIVVKGYVDGCAYQENVLPKKHKELGYDVTILVSQYARITKGRSTGLKEIGTKLNEDEIPVCVLKRPSFFSLRHLFNYKTIGMYEKLMDLSPDIIFIHNVIFSENRDVVKFIKRNPNTLVYADNHMDYYNNPIVTYKQKIADTLYRWNARKIKKITRVFWGTTPWRVEYLYDHYNLPKEKCKLLIMGGDESVICGINRTRVRQEVREKYNIPNDAFLIVTGGIIDKRKRQDLLMKAVDELSALNVWLIVFGEAKKEMLPICNEFSTSENIVFTGWVNADYSYSLFLASDLAVFPGTHSVLWEQAASCGIPQIIKRWPGMDHINVNGNAYLMDDVTIENLTEKIREYLNTETYDKSKQKAEIAAPFFYYREIAKQSIDY